MQYLILVRNSLARQGWTFLSASSCARLIGLVCQGRGVATVRRFWAIWSTIHAISRLGSGRLACRIRSTQQQRED